MRRIVLIKGLKDAELEHPKHKALIGTYGIHTFSKSNTISNLVDLISDIDLLLEVGHREYLSNKKNQLVYFEDVINDTMHLRNLFVMKDEELSELVEEERRAYVARADLKNEIQFLETNETFIVGIIKILSKINKFNGTKNERVYTPKVLSQYAYVMDNEGNELIETIENTTKNTEEK